MAKIKDPLYKCIHNCGLLQVVISEVFAKKATYLCRLNPGKEQEWLALMPDLLLAFENNDCELHLCRKYILKDSKMVYAWHLNFTGDLLLATKLCSSVLPTVKAATPLSKEILKGLRPRSPSPSGPDPLPPKGVKMALKIIPTGVGEKGQQYYEEHMPLPHYYKDSNAPSETTRGRGAKKI